ncbi:hypothetical protein BH10ACI2_BH10ACI2_26320 [soil metagenome]
MIGYRFLSPAETEMAHAALFYEKASIRLGSGFLDDVYRTINRLRKFPFIGTPIDNDLRGKVLGRFPYILIYAVETDAILIVAVAHQSQNPGYWESRLASN